MVLVSDSGRVIEACSCLFVSGSVVCVYLFSLSITEFIWLSAKS